MSAPQDPTKALMAAAAALPKVVEGTSCNQSSYKVGKRAFLYVGPGPKGVGYKAMFKLDASLAAAEEMSQSSPDRIEIGVGNWVTARFSSDEPLPKSVWGSWLKESYGAAAGT